MSNLGLNWFTGITLVMLMFGLGCESKPKIELRQRPLGTNDHLVELNLQIDNTKEPWSFPGNSGISLVVGGKNKIVIELEFEKEIEPRVPMMYNFFVKNSEGMHMQSRTGKTSVFSEDGKLAKIECDFNLLYSGEFRAELVLIDNQNGEQHTFTTPVKCISAKQ